MLIKVFYEKIVFWKKFIWEKKRTTNSKGAPNQAATDFLVRGPLGLIRSNQLDNLVLRLTGSGSWIPASNHSKKLCESYLWGFDPDFLWND